MLVSSRIHFFQPRTGLGFGTDWRWRCPTVVEPPCRTPTQSRRPSAVPDLAKLGSCHALHGTRLPSSLPDTSFPAALSRSTLSATNHSHTHTHTQFFHHAFSTHNSFAQDFHTQLWHTTFSSTTLLHTASYSHTALSQVLLLQCDSCTQPILYHPFVFPGVPIPKKERKTEKMMLPAPCRKAIVRSISSNV